MVIAQYFFITITSSPTDTTAAFTKTAAFTHCTAKTAKLATTPATPLPQRTRSQTRGRRLPLTALALALITLLPVTLLGLWQVHQLSGSAAQPHSASTRSSAAHMLPTLFLPHGGGPLPVLGDHGHTALTAFLKGAAARLPRQPKAILLVSAHWEERAAQLTSAPHPGMLYDYYGFPPESYKLSYPAPGSPQLAQQALELLRAASFADASLNPHRGYDHATFIPLLLMFPAADIPVVQLSLMSSLDPDEHYRMGAALAPLRQQDVLLVASGMSFHNMRKFSDGPEGAAPLVGQEFQRWLLQTCALPPEQRRAALNAWQTAPGARDAHPREEHLLPLMVAAGAADAGSSSDGSLGVTLFDAECMGAKVAGVGFGQFSSQFASRGA